jgi:N-acetylglutamate synthase-like GNAT family acetyltransferase
MISGIVFRNATAADDPQVRSLLESAGLPAGDVDARFQEYLLALDDQRLVGVVGLEIAGADGLVRSLVVEAAWRGCGIANELHDRVLALARTRGIRAVYLLTTTAEGYAAKRGFERVDRQEVPPGILSLAQFRALCPATAVCMRQRLS